MEEVAHCPSTMLKNDVFYPDEKTMQNKVSFNKRPSLILKYKLSHIILFTRDKVWFGKSVVNVISIILNMNAN